MDGRSILDSLSPADAASLAAVLRHRHANGSDERSLRAYLSNHFRVNKHFAHVILNSYLLGLDAGFGPLSPNEFGGMGEQPTDPLFDAAFQVGRAEFGKDISDEFDDLSEDSFGSPSGCIRFTGEWPPPELLTEYPNWENALDEEGVDGQDETTIRPADDQSRIGEYVAFTVGKVSLADQRELVAIVELGMDGVVGLNVLLNHEWFYLTRSVDKFNQFLEWKPIVEDWLPEKERSPSLDVTDSSIFPLQFVSRLPYYATSKQIKLVITLGGGEESWD